MAQLHLVGPLEAQSQSQSQSLKLWDLDWRTTLPWIFEEVTVECGTFEDALPFIGENYARIFGTTDSEARFLVEPMTAAKRRFGAEMDVFLFRAEQRIVGVIMSHPSDWSTYYLRTAAFLPTYRGRHLATRFLSRIVQPLRDAGVSRIESDVSPTNIPMMKVHQSAGFVASALLNSDRWGTVVRLIKFLDAEAEAVFARQFCGMVVQHQNNSKPELG